ncbi:MAG: hypothetical protein P8X91_10120, partial [Candidatus Bathyarchaeota archaeon]
MKFPLMVFLIIFSILIIFPTASGQISNEGTKQKSIEVTINSAGDVHVTHVIYPIDSPTEIKLIDGEKSNLKVKDEEGNDIKYDSIGKNESLKIFPSEEFVVVDYDVMDQLQLIKNVWTWDFLYLESTIFVLPEQVDLAFVNERPVYLGEAKGITCHGCQMVLEYSINEPKVLEKIDWEDKEFLVEIDSHSNIDNFLF